GSSICHKRSLKFNRPSSWAYRESMKRSITRLRSKPKLFPKIWSTDGHFQSASVTSLTFSRGGFQIVFCGDLQTDWSIHKCALEWEAGLCSISLEERRSGANWQNGMRPSEFESMKATG